jgi:Ca2+-transporting ATPase
MQVREANFFGDVPKGIIEEGVAVNSTAQLDMSNPEKPAVLGNPTEGALILWLRDRGVDYKELKGNVRELAEIPFSTERKFMASTVVSSDGRRRLYVKGAPEILLAMCAEIACGVTKKEITDRLTDYQNQAMRTLGFAYQDLNDDELGIDQHTLTADNLIFIGVVAISDPVRSDVPDAVKECIDAGINIKIVTGDTPNTAKEIGRQIGLWKSEDTDRNIITGPEFAALSEAELDERVMDLKIIARARPMDKKRLVESLQSKGQVVAVTGDGTNDAPALKAAHVGLSMGDGTSVAKEASDITIVDNSFASIGRAVMWGRSLFQNIRRFILFQMTVNVAACFIVLVGAFVGTESPLSVTQMLWVNLIMDTFAAMALSSLPPSSAVMKDKPRKKSDFIISKPMTRFIIGVGTLFFVVLLAFLLMLQRVDITFDSGILGMTLSALPHELSTYELSLFFTTFVFLQFWNLFNARAFFSGRSAFHFKNCSEFLMILTLIFVGQILIVTFGHQLFNVEPLCLVDWTIIILATSPVLIIGELWRALKK